MVASLNAGAYSQGETSLRISTTCGAPILSLELSSVTLSWSLESLRKSQVSDVDYIYIFYLRV